MRTDMNYLRTMSGDNPELMSEMIDIFTDQVDDLFLDMKKNLEQKDYETLGKVAHKAKSSVAIMGMNKLSAKLKELELLTKDNEKPETYPSYLDLFQKETKEAIIELKGFKESLCK